MTLNPTNCCHMMTNASECHYQCGNHAKLLRLGKLTTRLSVWHRALLHRHPQLLDCRLGRGNVCPQLVDFRLQQKT